MRSFGVFLTGLMANAMVLGACTSSTTPTPVVPPPPVADRPHITCPASQTAQSPDGGATAVAFPTPTVTNGQAPVTNACLPASGSPFTVGQRTVTCTAVDSLQRTDSCQFLVTVLNPPKLAATSFLAFGDSITWGEDGQNSTSSTARIMSLRFHPSVQMPEALQYPYVLQRSLAVRYQSQAPTVANKGFPGEAASDTDTLTRFTGLTATRQYSVVLIMEGTNDLYDRDDHIFPFAIDGLRSMIRDAKGKGIRPYLATIPPMDPTKCVPVCRGLPWSLVSGFNDNIRGLASTEGVTLVDVYQAFGGNLALIGPDGLHPAADGYAKIADTFFTAIKSTLETASAGSAVLGPRRPTSAAR